VLYEIKKHLPKRNKEDPKKKGKNNNKREPTLNQETTPKETTPKIAIAQPGATKERETATNGMSCFGGSSFIPFISSLTFSHPKMSSIQK
jgi:hypothetical protein